MFSVKREIGHVRPSADKGDALAPMVRHCIGAEANGEAPQNGEKGYLLSADTKQYRTLKHSLASVSS